MYEYADKIVSYMDGILVMRFSRLKSLVSFDELNVLQAVNELYIDIDKLMRDLFLRIAGAAYQKAVRKDVGRILDETWLDEILDGYDPTSKYVYSHEFDRKRTRLIEALVASPTKAEEVRAAMRSISLMFRIYAIRVTDEATLQAIRDDGEDWIIWCSENDAKVCSICHSRNGKMYEIEHIPPKPHINCRCWFKEVP